MILEIKAAQEGEPQHVQHLDEGAKEDNKTKKVR